MLVFNKKKIIIWLIVLLIVIAGGYYFISNRSQPEAVKLTERASSQKGQNEQQIALPSGRATSSQLGQAEVKQANLTQADKDILAARRTAEFFVAMLGSYSTSANFKNIIDLQPLMTERMLEWSKDFIQRNMNQANQQVSVITKVVSSELISKNNGNMVFSVKTVREEKGAIEKKYNQVAEISLIKTDKNWLVDWLNWK